MENTKHKCVIGFIYDYEDSDIVTLDDLNTHIEANRYAYDNFNRMTYYTLSDYCDKRKSVDMTRFNYCPICGKKIDWKAIKRADQCS